MRCKCAEKCVAILAKHMDKVKNNVAGQRARGDDMSVDRFIADVAMHVAVEPSGETFSVGGGRTILEAALASGVKLPYGCAAGNCGACKCRLVVGEVSQLGETAGVLSDQEIENGLILSCRARPTTAHTVIELLDASESGAPERIETRGVIVKTQRLTHDILEVELQLEEAIQFNPGQFAQVQISGLPRARCYSFAHRPGSNGLKKVRFFIRKVPGGAFTDKLFAGELANETLLITAPGGGFYLRSETQPMLCVAGGSGLAPVLSILEDAARKRMDRKCILIFGVRTPEDVYCLDRIRKVSERWAGFIDFKVVLSEAAGTIVDPDYRKGFVTEFFEDSFALLGEDKKAVEVYMAGPPPMVDAALARLDGMGVSRGNVYFDRFTDSRAVS